MKGCEIKK